jgi:hypothetical protein
LSTAKSGIAFEADAVFPDFANAQSGLRGRSRAYAVAALSVGLVVLGLLLLLLLRLLLRSGRTGWLPRR